MPRRLDASSPPYVAYVALACSVFRAYVRRSGVHVPACGRLVFLVSFLAPVVGIRLVWSWFSFACYFFFDLFGCLVFVLLLLSLFLVSCYSCFCCLTCFVQSCLYVTLVTCVLCYGNCLS